jgi:ribosomal protein L11 methylase PrmA
MFDPGSFRDPSGRVRVRGRQVLRAVFEPGRAGFEAARDAGIYDKAIAAGRLVGMKDADPAALAGFEPAPCHVVEHPCLDFVSYPYEWTFSALKAAALLHLDLHIDLLGDGFTLSDATAYNVQFRGTRPVFIDHLSIVPYGEGELWTGQRQFAMQFLNPLILWAKRGVAPNPWFRGSLEGIAPEELAPLLSLRDKLSFTVLAHVVAQSHAHRRSIRGGGGERPKAGRHLSKRALVAILDSLRDYVAGLSYPGGKSVWSDYAGRNSYDDERRAAKHDFVADMARSLQPALLFDIGCNSGDFTETAIDHGARAAVGFDFDFGALELAFARFDAAGSPVLPLWLDATNPSPSQGWAGAERKSLADRAGADALLALAVIHHLAIARNVPLAMAVDWLVGLAPAGIIEFPGKGDPMVQALLANRVDIFPDYGEEAFLAHVGARAAVTGQCRLGDNGRLLIRYDRRR